jgi:hypothetical protein
MSFGKHVTPWCCQHPTTNNKRMLNRIIISSELMISLVTHHVNSSDPISWFQYQYKPNVIIKTNIR